MFAIMMQRSPRFMFSAASSGAPIFFRAAATSAARFSPSAVTGGSLPSGGSTISDVRRFLASVFWCRSSPNCVRS